MATDHGSATVPERASGKQAIFVILVLIPIIAGYVVLGSKIGVVALYMGFLFSTYWGAIRMLAVPEYMPSLFGALLGIGNAWLFHALPAVAGTPGIFLALAATLIATYCMIRQHAQLFINPAFILFVTVATIPALGTTDAAYRDMVIGVLFGAFYAGAVVFVLNRITAMRENKSRAA